MLFNLVASAARSPRDVPIFGRAAIRIFATNLNALETHVFSVEQRPDESLPVNSEGSRTDTLRQISELIGGPVVPSDSTDEAISQAFAAANHMNYRIAFEADHPDGKYHKLRVVSTRKDVGIQAAGNYYALPDPDAQSRAETAEERHRPQSVRLR